MQKLLFRHVEEKQEVGIHFRRYAVLRLACGRRHSKEEYRALYKAISLLKDDYQEVVRLYYFDSMSVKEIASIVGQSTDNVKIQLYRARLKLKELLEATL